MLNGHHVRRLGGPHLPLRRLALCLDCEECFEIGADACPRCGTETWVPIARLLERTQDRRRNSAGARYVVIVARDQPIVYRQFAEAFRDDEAFEVIVDRRRRDRRIAPRSTGKERRVSDRRANKPATRLGPLGWVIARRSTETHASTPRG